VNPQMPTPLADGCLADVPDHTVAQLFPEQVIEVNHWALRKLVWRISALVRACIEQPLGAVDELILGYNAEAVWVCTVDQCATQCAIVHKDLAAGPFHHLAIEIPLGQWLPRTRSANTLAGELPDKIYPQFLAKLSEIRPKILDIAIETLEEGIRLDDTVHRDLNAEGSGSHQRSSSIRNVGS